MRHPKVLLQTPGHREDALRQFMRSKECIFLSVNYAEGINLKGENFQRNIIAKVPYPSLGDEWVIKRNETDKAELNIDKWYRLTTAVAIQQAAGRTTRDPDDFSKTYILDSNFGFFYSQNKNLLEPWFRDAIIWRK
jgi:Rad3-related DNA helicase